MATPRIFGDNSHGFRNAKEIATGLNGCRVRNLRGSLLDLINTMFLGASLTDVISCSIIKNGKPDIQITIGNQTKNVSIFVGSGNSVHQENFVEFLDFCRETLHMNQSEENALRTVFYGDGTLDGSGQIKDRLKDSRIIKQKYPKHVDTAQLFFDQHRRELARRFLVTGKYIDKPEADYVFHGDVQKGISMSYNDILDYIENFEGSRNGLLSIGPLSFQMWNRNLSGSSETEYKRKSLQIKWASMPETIKEAFAMMKVKEERLRLKGINAEYELVSALNKNRSDRNYLWQTLTNYLGVQSKNVFAIRVSRQVRSEFLDQTIYPKSDIYLCETNISEEILQSVGYALDEDLVNEYDLNIIPIKGSGISCKIPTSNKFTYAKMSISSFVKIFGNNILGAGASIYVRGKDIKLNHSVLSAWGVSEDKFIDYLKTTNLLPTCNSLNDISENEWGLIKKHCNYEIESIIKSNQAISDMIFIGKGLFDDPYYAPLIFSQGELKANIMPHSFAVTTGSGRHKGKFTIVIKPRISTISFDHVVHKYDEELSFGNAAENENN